MASLHWGTTKHPGKITFTVDGYHYKAHDGPTYTFIKYPEPKDQVRTIKRMYGFSIWHSFVGIIVCDEVK